MNESQKPQTAEELAATQASQAFRAVARGAGAALRDYLHGPDAAPLREAAKDVDAATGGVLSRMLRASIEQIRRG